MLPMQTFKNAIVGNSLKLERDTIKTLQVNMGNLCNQSCIHCHMGASPDGKKIMSKEIIEDILTFLKGNQGLILDITGGAPELNPFFDYLVQKARALVKEIIVRSNLTIIFEPDKKYLPEFFKANKIHLICSLPCYTEPNVDAQRGLGVFTKSIKALLLLNNLGFGKEKSLKLDIVYNPGGAFLPGKQVDLERDYRKNLTKYGVTFNQLLTITNVPITRFKDFLEKQKEYSKYLDTLRDCFNPDAAQNIMCKSLLSVGFNGKIYDCDFNQALGWALKDNSGNILLIGELRKDSLKDIEILFGEHCFSCTAGQGSSCFGALK